MPIIPKLPHILYGGDYNPEQWPEEVWAEDAQLMRTAGVNLATLGVFAWAWLEPSPGAYDFGWLDRVLALLHEQGVSVDLATATASPPPWLIQQHPDILPQTREGATLWPGARQHFCPSSPRYRQAAAALVEQLATRYKDHPALALWHIGNEYGCHVAECYCDVSAAAFRAWLRLRYGSLDELNIAWGTAFWSQRYSEWEQILPPRQAPTLSNPTQQLDFKRFSSDELLRCYEAEHAVLQRITPDIPVTTNFMSFFKPVNYQQWAPQVDVVSLDSYPDPTEPTAHIEQAMTFDQMRTLKHGTPWLLMEQTPSQVNWRARNALKRPGQMRLWSYQALAHGAEGVLFFQWRASRAGAEKFHGGMVPHVGTERSRVWDEVVALGAELATLDTLVGARGQAQVAILFDWESWWALELDSHPSDDVRLLDQVRRFYAPLHTRNIAVDFVAPTADLKGYRLALAPNLYLVSDRAAENIRTFVMDGGSLMMSFFSGIVDERDHIRLGGYPAPFRELLGVRVEEFDPYAPRQTNELLTTDWARYPCDLWSDVIDLEGAEVLATYTRDFYAGRPAVTRHRFGQGMSYYLGTRPDPLYLATLLGQVCETAGVQPALREAPTGVEVIRRARGDTSFLFALNHNNTMETLRLEHPGRDLLTGLECAEALLLAPYGVAIVEEAHAPQS